MTVHKLNMMVEGCLEVAEDEGRMDVGSGMIVFPQLVERACSLQLDIVAVQRCVGVLQLPDAGWHSDGTQGIPEPPSLRIAGYSIDGVVLTWMRVEEVSGNFLGRFLLLPWLFVFSFLHALVDATDVIPGGSGLGALDIGMRWT